MEEQEQQEMQTLEMQALSEDFFSVEELEERLELAAGIIDPLSSCTGNYCAANACSGNTSSSW